MSLKFLGNFKLIIIIITLFYLYIDVDSQTHSRISVHRDRQCQGRQSQIIHLSNDRCQKVSDFKCLHVEADSGKCILVFSGERCRGDLLSSVKNEYLEYSNNLPSVVSIKSMHCNSVGFRFGKGKFGKGKNRKPVYFNKHKNKNNRHHHHNHHSNFNSLQYPYEEEEPKWYWL